MDALREAARRDGLGPAVAGPTASGPGEPVRSSWGELDRIADRAALRLAEAGVGPGDPVGALLPPSPEAVALLHGIPRAGGIFLPLNAGSTVPELARACRAIGTPRLLLVPGEWVDGLRKALAGVAVVAVEEIVDLTRENDEAADPVLRPALPEIGPDTPVAVLLTSGSTGRSRPVPITAGNLAASARGVIERLRLDPLDTWFAALSPAHVGGLALLHRAAVVGCPVVTRPRFEAEELLELARDGGVTHASLVPTMLQRLLGASEEGRAPRGLRCLLVGGARTPRGLLDRALAGRWPVALTYGLTEATSQVATAAPDRVREKRGAVGRPLAGVEVAIHEPDGEGIGEILVRGPTVAPIAPEAAPAIGLDRAGWLRTGDLGTLDADGDLRVVGRRSDRIVTGGVTVEPAEVEEALLDHPAVAEVAVTGRPDDEWGERIVAVVAPHRLAAAPTLEEILEHARPRLSAAKRPREVRVVEALPRTATGKVDRRRLAELTEP